jgi:hypothetical protein
MSFAKFSGNTSEFRPSSLAAPLAGCVQVHRHEATESPYRVWHQFSYELPRIPTRLASEAAKLEDRTAFVNYKRDPSQTKKSETDLA